MKVQPFPAPSLLHPWIIFVWKEVVDLPANRWPFDGRSPWVFAGKILLYISYIYTYGKSIIYWKIPCNIYNIQSDWISFRCFFQVRLLWASWAWWLEIPTPGLPAPAVKVETHRFDTIVDNAIGGRHLARALEKKLPPIFTWIEWKWIQGNGMAWNRID